MLNEVTEMIRPWRYRIGLLVPPTNIVMEKEFNVLIPECVSVHAARLYRKSSSVTESSLKEMIESIPAVAFSLSMTQPDVVVFGCTSGSLIYGVGWDEELARSIETKTRVDTFTTSCAVLHSLRALNVKRIALVTPYVEAINDLA